MAAEQKPELLAIYCLNTGGDTECQAIIDLAFRPRRRQAVLIDVGAHGPKLADWLFSDMGVADVRLIVMRGTDGERLLTLAAFVAAYNDLGGRIEAVRFLTEEAPRLHPLLGAAGPEAWQRQNRIPTVEVVTPPTGGAYAEDEATSLLPASAASYRLFALWPPGSPRAAIRLAWRAGDQTIALFGGGLDYADWRRLAAWRDISAQVLIAPCHGGPGEPDRKFGPTELAEAVRPIWALVPVGTVQALEAGDQRRPHASLVHAMQEVGATILCTQITRRCAIEKNLDRAVKPVLAPLDQLADLSITGRGCAGTILVVLAPDAVPRVARAAEHKEAVDLLAKMGEPRPLCRGGEGRTSFVHFDKLTP